MFAGLIGPFAPECFQTVRLLILVRISHRILARVGNPGFVSPVRGSTFSFRISRRSWRGRGLPKTFRLTAVRLFRRGAPPTRLDLVDWFIRLTALFVREIDGDFSAIASSVSSRASGVTACL